MAPKPKIGPVRIVEESGEKFALIPESQFRDMIAFIEDLEDALDIKKAMREGDDFITLDELDAELAKAGLS